MDLRIKALESQFKPSTLNIAGKQYPAYKVAILINDKTNEEFGYRITKNKKFQTAQINDVLTNFELQRNSNNEIIVSFSNHDREIHGMQMVKPTSFSRSNLIKK